MHQHIKHHRMNRSAISHISVIKVNSAGTHQVDDWLAAEEPLEIRLSFGALSQRKQQSISVTMRTPGNDFELATGFLFTEGIIKGAEDIQSIKHCNGTTRKCSTRRTKRRCTGRYRQAGKKLLYYLQLWRLRQVLYRSSKNRCRLSNITNDTLQFSSHIIHTFRQCCAAGKTFSIVPAACMPVPCLILQVT